VKTAVDVAAGSAACATTKTTNHNSLTQRRSRSRSAAAALPAFPLLFLVNKKQCTNWRGEFLNTLFDITLHFLMFLKNRNLIFYSLLKFIFMHCYGIKNNTLVFVKRILFIQNVE